MKKSWIETALTVLAMVTLATSGIAQSSPASSGDAKYREAIERAIKEGKREFSAHTEGRVQIIVQAASNAGFKVSTQKLAQGMRVVLIRP